MRKPAITGLLCLVGICALGLMVRARHGNAAGSASNRQQRISDRALAGAVAVGANVEKLSDGEKKGDVVHEYAKLPMAFEPNLGQSNKQANFVARGDGYTLFLTPAEAVLALQGRPSGDRLREKDASAEARATGTVRMKLVGANPAPIFAPVDELPGRSNYLIGNDPANWHVNVPNYRKVAERDVYRGIDLVYYGTQRQLEYDFVIAAGADPGVIGIAIEGSNKLRIDAQGEVIASLKGGDVRLRKPVAYQEAEGGKQTVAANYTLRRDGGVAFRLGNYDPSRTLVIDPILSYSTYLGGSNIDGANAIAVAPDKTAFITGGTFSLDFPTAHPLQPNHGGPDDFDRDAFVTKISADGSTLLYSTYLGGKNQDVGNGIAVDSFGDAYVTGTTLSPDFPVTPGSFNTLCGSDGFCGSKTCSPGLFVSNAFVSKLNPEGSGLIYSGFLGEFENVRGQAISVDANQIAYVTGSTQFNPLPQGSACGPFPITGNAFQPTFGGGASDAYVTKISSAGSQIQYSSYIGGSDEEIGYGIAPDGNANAYVTGLTYSSDLRTTANALQPTYGGAGDAFFLKVNTSGSGPSSLVYSTFLGGSNLDQGNGIAVDTNGIAYITGIVGMGALPFSTASLCTSGVKTTTGPCGGTADAFAAKMDATKSGVSSLLYFTYLGGSLADGANGIAVDASGNVYITGSTVSTDFPVTPAIFQPKYGGGNADAFVTTLDRTGSILLYSTYLGGTNTDAGLGIAVDSTATTIPVGTTPTTTTVAAAYVAGQTCSEDFPLANPLQPAPGGNCDAFVSKVEILQGLELNPAGLIFSGQSLGTASQPQVVTITDGDIMQSIGTIAIMGANPGDFVQTNNCGSSLAPGAQCSVSVTFNPQAAGIRKAQVNVPCTTCGTSGITYVLNLTGTTSALTLSASNLTFDQQHVGVASSPLPITATNEGTVPITFSSITASGDFAETDNCTKVALQPTTNCVINVTYTPTTAGSSVGALTLTDSALGSPQVVLLTGTGFGQQSDFTLSATPTSAAVPAGKSAQFTLTISPIGGFAQPITLSCSGLPKGTSCSATANPVTLSGTTTVTVMVNTGLRTFVPSTRPITVKPPQGMRIDNSRWLAFLVALMLLVTAFFGLRVRRSPAAAALLVAIVVILLSVACNGGGQAGTPNGTPAGTYQIGITGTSGVLSHTANVTLQVE